MTFVLIVSIIVNIVLLGAVGLLVWYSIESAQKQNEMTDDVVFMLSDLVYFYQHLNNLTDERVYESDDRIVNMLEHAQEVAVSVNEFRSKYEHSDLLSGEEKELLSEMNHKLRAEQEKLKEQQRDDDMLGGVANEEFEEKFGRRKVQR